MKGGRKDRWKSRQTVIRLELVKGGREEKFGEKEPWNPESSEKYLPG